MVVMPSFVLSVLSCARKLITVVICLVVTGYICLPLALIYQPHVVDFFVFLNHVALPFTRNFSDLAHFGLDHVHATSHHVSTPDGVTLGAWLIQPPPGVKARHQVIIYHHGNSGTRGTPHRIALYNVLANAGFDVVTFDYRGYADSTCPSGECQPSEKGLILDATTMYSWVLADIEKRWKGTKDSVIIWGHSLGGGAATNLAKELCSRETGTKCSAVRAVVLESTFSDVADAAVQYPLAWALRLYGPALETLPNALIERHLSFNNTASLSFLPLPVLMVHAADDLIVPAELSRRAFVAADAVRPDDWPPIEYKLFPAQFGYGHRSLHDAPDLVPSVIDFLNRNTASGQ